MLTCVDTQRSQPITTYQYTSGTCTPYKLTPTYMHPHTAVKIHRPNTTLAHAETAQGSRESCSLLGTCKALARLGPATGTTRLLALPSWPKQDLTCTGSSLIPLGWLSVLESGEHPQHSLRASPRKEKEWASYHPEAGASCHLTLGNCCRGRRCPVRCVPPSILAPALILGVGVVTGGVSVLL